MRPYGTSEQLSKRRKRALGLLEGGKSVKEIAAKVNVNERSVRRWRQAQRHPRKKSACSPGQLPYLTDKQRKKLEQELLKGAYAHGYSEDYWTLDRVGHVIWELFKIRYSSSGAWRLLDRMNWSCQKVQRIALQRNDEAVTRWRQRVWPRIKKVARVEGHAGVSR
jgi:transposase